MATTPQPVPSKAQLFWTGILQFFMAGIVGVFFLPLVYTIITGQRETMTTSLISAGIAMLAYLPLHLKHGFKEREKFIANGGDTKGMNLWMFGAMGFDWRNPEGRF